MKRVVILASGSGSNAENIIRYFQDSESVQIDSVWSNHKDAPVLARAKRLGVDSEFFTRTDFSGSDKLLNELKSRNIDIIILAGFLWLVPQSFIDEFEIINIHPALLPAYGGKGMYGHHVHEAVIKNGETESGITIHLVNSEYDKGKHLFQAKCPVLADDTPDTLAERIHKLEYMHFPRVIRDFCDKE